MGVSGVKCDTAETFHAELKKAIEEPGPHLIEAVL
jgi:thiamine pyrophosphate-dependent acetolactate synthase large subunit-like protein